MEQKATTFPQEQRAGSTAFWLLLFLPILYLLSFGPVLALVERSGNRNLRDRVSGFYEPVAWLHDHTVLRKPLEKYYDVCGGGK